MDKKKADAFPFDKRNKVTPTVAVGKGDLNLLCVENSILGVEMQKDEFRSQKQLPCGPFLDLKNNQNAVDISFKSKNCEIQRQQFAIR